MPSKEPLPHSLLGKRSILRLRRRSDKVWFVVTSSCFLFWGAVLTYKLKYESPDVVNASVSKEEIAPESEREAGAEEAPPQPPSPPAPLPSPLPALPPPPAPKAEPKMKPVEAAKPAEKPKPPEKAKTKEPPPPVVKKKEPVKAFAGPAVLTLDSCESTDGWLPAQDHETVFTVNTQPGRRGNAVTLNFEWKGDKWVAIRKSFSLAISPQGVLFLSVRKEGTIDKIEIKIADKDGSRFGKTFHAPLFSNNWAEFRIPVPELHYLWGGDNVLNMESIQGMDIAVSGPNGHGKVFIDEIRYQK